MKHIPFSGVVPVGCLYWEQHQAQMGDKRRRRVQAVGEQSRIIIARVSLGPGPPSCLLPGMGGTGQILLLLSRGFWNSHL